MKPAAHLAACAACACLPLCAAESRVLFVPQGADTAAWEQHYIAPLKAAEPGVEWVLIEIPAKADSPAAAKAQAQALGAGVTALPAVGLRDEQGVYATLPLPGLTPEKLAEARALAQAPGREDAAARRRFEALCYLLCARIASPDMDDEALAAAIAECRLLLEHPKAEPAERQFLGLRCLYPLLLEQYVRAYDGAHSPYTEAKLLEAIAALEAARDLDRETKLGKAAFAERERLRAARRKARQYE